MIRPFKGLHIVRKRLACGTLTSYYYAWRGGPRIEEDYGTPEFAEAFADAHRKKGQPTSGSFNEAINSYLSSAKFSSLAPRTQSEYRRHIDLIRDRFGEAKLSYFNNQRTRRLIYGFRDQFAKNKRKADHVVAVLSAILTFLVDQARLERNVAAGMKKLYRPDRAAIVWSDDEIDRVCDHASEQLTWTIRLEALTGMRTGDLIAVPWSAVQSNCINWKTSKTKAPVFIPITDELRLLLNDIPRVATTIVTNSRSLPWTEDGLKTMWGRAKKASNVQGKHFHDLRGTAATKLILAGLTDPQVGAIIGWSPKRVAEIRAHYVDRDMIIQGVIDHLEENKERTKTVNRCVNQPSEQAENDG